MESGPAVFAGVASAVFGAALLLWVSVRAWSRRPVAEGVSPAVATALTGVFGVISVMSGLWVLLSG